MIVQREILYLLILIVLCVLFYRIQYIQENLSIVPADGEFTKGNVNQLIPRGAIVSYYPQGGDLSRNPVPSGWAICDGNNGTPDLRGRFLRMYSDDLGGFNSWKARVDGNVRVDYPTDIAGLSRQDSSAYILKHRIGDRAGTDHHVLVETEMPPHSHSTFGPQNNCWKGGSCGGDYLVPGGYNRQTSVTGSGWGHNNQPPYFVVVFIMKL